MIEQSLIFYISVILTVLVLFVASLIIPLYGFIIKRWKGVALGCLLQPVFCFIIIMVASTGAAFYQKHKLAKHISSAMVVVREVVPNDSCADTCTWYLKPNDECFFLRKVCGNTKSAFTQDQNMRLFDVVPTDSMSVCVDDIVVVSFDTSARKVTASDFGEPTSTGTW